MARAAAGATNAVALRPAGPSVQFPIESMMRPAPSVSARRTAIQRAGVRGHGDLLLGQLGVALKTDGKDQSSLGLNCG